MAIVLTSLFTFPVAIFSAGIHGPFVTPAVPIGAYGYQLQFVKTGWPGINGSDVAIFTVEESYDGGVTWPVLNTATHTQNATPLATETWSVSFGTTYNGGPVITTSDGTFKLRLTVNALTPCTAAVVVKSMS